MLCLWGDLLLLELNIHFILLTFVCCCFFTQIITTGPTCRLYRSWKRLSWDATSFTACASSTEPRPPLDQWWHGTAAEAPEASAMRHTKSISAWVSVLQRKRNVMGSDKANQNGTGQTTFRLNIHQKVWASRHTGKTHLCAKRLN